jgi:hypothetical protein
MKRTKAKAKATLVHIVTYGACEAAWTREFEAKREADIHEHDMGWRPQIKPGYLIRAEDLPGIVERMAKARAGAYFWKRIRQPMRELFRDTVREDFKAIGILADARGIDAQGGK